MSVFMSRAGSERDEAEAIDTVDDDGAFWEFLISASH